jgi:cell division protease FtsH
LKENADVVHRLAEVLLERETISGSDLTKLMNNEELPPFVPPEDRKNGKQAESGQLEAEERQESEEAVDQGDNEAGSDDGPEFSFKDDEDSDKDDRKGQS